MTLSNNQNDDHQSEATASTPAAAVSVKPSLAIAPDALAHDVFEAVEEAVKEPRLQRLGFKLFEKSLLAMDRGALTVTYPDGRQVTYGNNAAEGVAELTIHHPRFFRTILLFSHVGFGEAYVEGDWDTPDVYAVIRWFLLNMEASTVLEGSPKKEFWLNCLGFINLVGHLLKPNSVTGSKAHIEAHYDLSNDLFQTFLDPSMTYSSGLFLTGEESLEQAQEQKYKALCEKLQLKEGESVLEIGCGWGGLSMYMARHYQCRIKAITISKKQYDWAKSAVEAAGLAHLIQVSYLDYRHVVGQFDKIVSVEMIEALGDDHYETFFAACNQLLKPDGLLVLQMILCPDHRFGILKRNVDFIQKHIFPGSLIPSLGRLTQAAQLTGELGLFELSDMGLSYAQTLRCWLEAFDAHRPQVEALGFDELFIRKWRYYLQYCEAAFAMRQLTVSQAVFTRPNNQRLMNQHGLRQATTKGGSDS